MGQRMPEIPVVSVMTGWQGLKVNSKIGHGPLIYWIAQNSTEYNLGVYPKGISNTPAASGVLKIGKSLQEPALIAWSSDASRNINNSELSGVEFAYCEHLATAYRTFAVSGHKSIAIAIIYMHDAGGRMSFFGQRI